MAALFIIFYVGATARKLYVASFLFPGPPTHCGDTCEALKAVQGLTDLKEPPSDPLRLPQKLQTIHFEPNGDLKVRLQPQPLPSSHHDPCQGCSLLF
jgi:hypothetical protein